MYDLNTEKRENKSIFRQINATLNRMANALDLFLSYIPREFDLRLSIFLYLLSALLLLVWSENFSNVLAFFISWMATALMLLHIFRLSSIRTPFSAQWRTVPLFIYGIVSSSLLASSFSSNDGTVEDSLSHGSIIGIVGIVVSLYSSFVVSIFPLPGTPRLRGKFVRVGTNSFILPKSGGRTVQCWFPLSNAKPISWWRWLFLCERKKGVMWTSGNPQCEIKESRKLFEALNKVENVPLFILNHLHLARCRAEWCDEINLLSVKDTEKYPVAIFSHGLKGWRQIHHTACEQLASYGFIVFSMDHTPDAMVSRPHMEPEKSKNFSFECEDDPNYGPAYRSFYRKGIERRALDIKTLIDYLQSINTLAAKLDLKRIFMWGHSYGGGTAATVAALDNRIAGVGLWDSWLFPMPDEVRSMGSTAPVLAISSEHWERGKFQAPFREDYLKNTRSKFPGCDLIFKGTDHNNFCDIIHLASKFLLIRPSMLGRQANPNVTAEALDRLLVALFACLAYSKTFPSVLDDLYSTSGDIDPASDEHTRLMVTSRQDKIVKLIDVLIAGQYEIREKLGSNYDVIDDSVKTTLLRSLSDIKDMPHCYNTEVFHRVSSPAYNDDL